MIYRISMRALHRICPPHRGCLQGTHVEPERPGQRRFRRSVRGRRPCRPSTVAEQGRYRDDSNTDRFMCYAYLVASSRYDDLDELLTRILITRQRPDWRRRLLDSAGPVTSMSSLRALRAVELRERAGQAASIGDVAEFLAVDHSTASRTVSAIVVAGLLTKQ